MKGANMLPWTERVNMLSINPDAATRGDIARMAAELSEYMQNDEIKNMMKKGGDE